MNPPRWLWQGLESVPGLRASRIEWQMLFGPELSLLDPILRPTGEIAASYPCPNPAKRGSYHKVVEHGPDDYVGVCPVGCPTVPIPKSDIIICKVDLRALGHVVALALGVTPQDEAFPGTPMTRRIGTFSPTAGYQYPVFLTMQMGTDRLLRVVEKLAAEHDQPFIIVAPTHDLRTSGSDRLLEKRKACLLTLSDIFGWDDRGKLIRAQKPAELLAEFVRSVLPAPEDRSGMAVFRTPANATWGDVCIRFIDGHTVHVQVGQEQGKFTYAQMGMADGRSGKPTKQWELLREFAHFRGTVRWRSPSRRQHQKRTEGLVEGPLHPPASRRNQKRREKLANDLRKFFRIDGDPFRYDYADRSWQTHFHVTP